MNGFIQAKHYRPGRLRPVRLIAIHTAECPLRVRAAKSVAGYFATTDRQASAHVTVDMAEAWRSVKDSDTAFAASKANADGLHLELATYAATPAAGWADRNHQAMLDVAATQVREWATTFDIPLRRLTVEQVKDGKSKGLTDHATISAAFPSTGHTDPGPNFPWPYFLDLLSPLPIPEEDDVARFVAAASKPGTIYIAAADRPARLITATEKRAREKLGVPPAVILLPDDELNALKGT